MKAPLRVLLAVLLVCVGGGLAGCSSDGGVRVRVEAALERLDGAVAHLGKDLDANRLRNAQLIKEYAAKVAAQKPDIRDLTRVLAREATREGTLYTGLTRRLEDVGGCCRPKAPSRRRMRRWRMKSTAWLPHRPATSSTGRLPIR